MRNVQVFIWTLTTAACLAWTAGCTRAPEHRHLEWPVMGTTAAVSFRGDAPDLEQVRSCVADIYEALNAKLSAWDPDSELSQFARSGSNDLRLVSADVRPCYEAAFRLARESGKAFNPRLGATLRELGFTRVSDVDLGAIAKGFAVDRAHEALVAAGLSRRPDDGALLLDLGGNLRAVAGTWRTGVRNPFVQADRSLPPVAAILTLTNGEAVATSGNYERFVERDGRRLSHILDGRTGEPVEGMAGVTVLAPTAMLADGLSTTLFVLGPADGMAFLDRYYPHTAALWIPDTPSHPHIIATSSMRARLEEVRFPVDARQAR